MYRRFRSPNAGQTSLTLQHATSPGSGFRPALGHNRDGYPTGGIPVQGYKSGGRVGFKKGTKKNWIQDVNKSNSSPRFISFNRNSTRRITISIMT